MAQKYFVGWSLDRQQREDLLREYPAAYPDIDADHVTLVGHAEADVPPPEPADAAIIGMVDDGKGVQARVIAIDGSPDRPDGGTFHITWSVDAKRGRTAKESNDALAALGWRPLPRHSIRVTPTRRPV